MILIVAPPGDLQIGLQALLTAHLEVDVLVTSERSSALKVIETQNPDMVILDHNLPSNTTLMIINQIQSSWPDIRCIVLVNDEEGRQNIQGAGSDLIVIKGFPGANLVAEIEKLLHKEDLDNPTGKDLNNEIHNKG